MDTERILIELIELGVDLEKIKEDGKFAAIEYMGTWDDEDHYWYYWYSLDNLNDADLEHLKSLCNDIHFRGFGY